MVAPAYGEAAPPVCSTGSGAHERVRVEGQRFHGGRRHVYVLDMLQRQGDANGRCEIACMAD